MRRALLLALLAGCAAGPPVSVDVHEGFASLRPVMVAVRAEGPEGAAAALATELYQGLIEKDYSALAPGAPAGSEGGFLRARLTTEAPPWDAEATLEDPFGTVLYRSTVSGFRGGPEAVARELLRGLPRK